MLFHLEVNNKVSAAPFSFHVICNLRAFMISTSTKVTESGLQCP